MQVLDLEVNQQVTCVFGGSGKLIKNKIMLPAVVTGVTAEGLYNVRTVVENIVIDISNLGMEHIQA